MKITFSAAASPAADPASIRLISQVIANKDLPADLAKTVAEGASAARFTAKPGQIFESFAESEGKTVRLALAGAHAQGKTATNGKVLANFELAGAGLAGKYAASGETVLALDAGKSGLAADQLAAVLTGLVLRAWRHDIYRTKLKEEQKITLAEVVIYGAPDGAQEAWANAEAIVNGVKLTRELVAEPANIVYPESFVARCRERFAGTGAEIEVLDEAAMRALGMNALLGVSKGSEREGQLLVIRWNGGEKNAKPAVFVGKGVTFDSGGISLKPGPGMEDMKWDMGGAGAVAGAMLALAGRKAAANVVGVCGLVENMPDGGAMRPSDVVTTLSGQTVEVINTDAEGRLVLCDALTWAQRNLDPKLIVDLATLTGAMLIALGHEQAGLFTNNDVLADQLTAAGKASGDKVWRMPLGPAYDKLIDSPIADIRNVGPRVAGSITAAQFLQRFIENDLPWAHLDIAGMAWADKAGATWGKGATGYGVRLLDQFVRDTLEA